jgi:hypothetical protein
MEGNIVTRNQDFLVVSLTECYTYQREFSKKGWQGNVKCQLCNKKKTIYHLFMSWSVAKLVRSVRTFNFHELFDFGFNGFGKNSKKKFGKKDKRLITIGIVVVVWKLWKFGHEALF